MTDMDGRIAGGKGIPVIRGHKIGHHPHIQRRPVLREQAVQAGIQVHGRIPHANNDHTYLSHSRLHLRHSRRKLYFRLAQLSRPGTFSFPVRG